MTNIGSSALLEADRFLNYNPKAFLYTGAHAPARYKFWLRGKEPRITWP